MERPRRILIASYYFPPDAAVGGLRAAKFARYLPEFGWEPHVLTTADGCRDQGLDHDRLRGLERVPVVKVTGPPTVRDAYLAARRFFGRGSSERPTEKGDSPRFSRGGSTTGDSPRFRQRVLQAIKRYGISLFVLLPDTKKNWALAAAVRAVRLIRRHEIDCVLTSSPPFSVNVVGLAAKLLTGARWIADLRDPWMEMVLERSPQTRSRASDLIERWMEWSVMRFADRVVTTTDALRQSLMARYPSVPADKFVYIPNSIDTDRMTPGGCGEKYDRFTITYAGTLYFDRTPEPLFAAVGALLRAGEIAADDVRITLLGKCQYINGEPTHAVARRYGVEGCVEVTDTVPYSDAIRIMQKSHLLLVIAPERHRLVVGAKLFDYLGSGSKILALAEEGATSDLINDTKSGDCFSHADVAGLRAYLHGLISDGSYARLRNDPGAFHHYSVRHLTARLSAELSASPAARIRAAESWSR